MNKHYVTMSFCKHFTLVPFFFIAIELYQNTVIYCRYNSNSVKHSFELTLKLVTGWQTNRNCQVYRAAFAAEIIKRFLRFADQMERGKVWLWKGPPIIFEFKYWCRCFKCLIVKLNISIYIMWQSLKKCLVITIDSLPIFYHSKPVFSLDC